MSKENLTGQIFFAHLKLIYNCTQSVSHSFSVINYKLNKPYYTKHIFHDEFDINKLYIVILAQVHIESVKFGYFEKLLSYSDTMLSRLSWFEVGLALTLIHWDFM